jgi:low affinity Fe/Cu permease
VPNSGYGCDPRHEQLFHFSNTWQLVVNTATTIITVLMVFLIQHPQNRDLEAVKIKCNELIRVSFLHRKQVEGWLDLKFTVSAANNRE